MAEVLVQLAEWNKEALVESATSLISLYAKHLYYLGADDWVGFANDKLIPTIKDGKLCPVSMKALGFWLTYYPPRLDMTDNKLSQLEPNIKISDYSLYNLLPRDRTRFYKTTLDIAEEIKDTNKVVFDKNSTVFRFPRNFYASNEQSYTVKLLGT